MRTPKPLHFPPCTAHVLTSAELRALGVSRRRSYASDLSRPIRGVVAAPGLDPAAHDTLLAAVRAIFDEGHFFSRRTAASELEIPVRASGAIEVGAVRPRKPRRRAEIAGHQLRPGVLRELPQGPLWLPHPADAWGLLAAVGDIGELVAAGDFLISGKSRYAIPACAREELEETVQRFHGIRGIDRLKQALPLLRAGVESPAESSLRLVIVRAGLPTPLTSCPVETRGRLLYADLGYPELRIAIEYDGAYHFDGNVHRARLDNERIEAMVDAGWRVLRVTALDLKNPRKFLQRLVAAIQERGAASLER